MTEIEITDDAIRIYDAGDREIVGWIKDEWIEDPDVVFSIVNAVLLKLTDQDELLRLLKK